MDTVIEVKNPQYEKQLNGRMMRLLNAYMSKFNNMKIEQKEIIIKKLHKEVTEL